MHKIWRLTAFVGAAMLALIVAVAAGAAANPQATYTCTKTKRNGDVDVRVDVPEAGVGGLTNAGFICVMNTSEESTDPGDNDPEDTDDTNQGETGDTEQDDPGEDTSENDEDEASDDVDSSASVPAVDAPAPAEPRSLYCATTPLERGNGDGVGIALNLTKDQGEHMVTMGLATPAIFYEGLGASCDVLPGYKDAGVWVDNVGDVVPGVAVYPLFVEV